MRLNISFPGHQPRTVVTQSDSYLLSAQRHELDRSQPTLREQPPHIRHRHCWHHLVPLLAVTAERPRTEWATEAKPPSLPPGLRAGSTVEKLLPMLSPQAASTRLTGLQPSTTLPSGTQELTQPIGGMSAWCLQQRKPNFPTMHLTSQAMLPRGRKGTESCKPPAPRVAEPQQVWQPQLDCRSPASIS